MNKTNSSNLSGLMKTLLPKLRFPEFLEEAGWKNVYLGNLFSDRQEIGFVSLPLLSLTDKEGIIPQENSNRKNNSSVDKSKYLRVCIGDIAYNTMRMWEGRSAFVGLEGVVSPAYTVCKPNDGVDGLFFSYYFKTNQLIEQFRKYSQGLVKDTLSLKFLAFSKISVPTPSFSEQQKIADCLTSLDDLIAAQSQKVETLQTYKKGLMQNLFPAEGESVPRLRFPEFESAGEWEEKTINEVGEIITGNTPSTVHPEYYGGNRFFVSPADISDQRYVNKTKTTLSELGFNQTRHIKANSILFVCIGSTIGKVAQNLYECATNQQINSIIPNSEHSNAFVYFNLEKNAKKISKLAGKQAVPIINKTTFASVAIQFPSLPEQQRIAELLSAVDEEISAQGEAVAALKVHKKGLMQGLFVAGGGGGAG